MIDCDFTPADYLQARSQQRAVKVRGTLLSVMIVLMVLWVVVNQHQVSRASAMLNEVASQKDQLADHLAKKAAMEAEQARLRDQLRLMEQFQSHASPVVVFSDLSRRLPETVVLTSVRYRSPSLHRYAGPSAPAPPDTPGTTSIAPVPAGKEPMPARAATEIVMVAFASEISEAIKCAAALERSPLVARVQTELKGDGVWAGRQGQQIVLTCELVEQSGVSE